MPEQWSRRFDDTTKDAQTKAQAIQLLEQQIQNLYMRIQQLQFNAADSRCGREKVILFIPNVFPSVASSLRAASLATGMLGFILHCVLRPVGGV